MSYNLAISSGVYTYSTPSSEPSWQTRPNSEIPLVEEVLAPVSNSTIDTVRISAFGRLVSGSSPVGGQHLQRAMQILSRYGLDHIVYMYWPSVADDLVPEENIQGSISLRDLEEEAGTYSELKKKLTAFFTGTNIDNSIIELVNSETASLGKNRDLVSCLVLYMVIIGEARRRGDYRV